MSKKGLFGTSGIRGSAETLFTDQFCFDLGRTFALFLAKYHQSGPVAIGMDPRSSSPRIKEALEKGLIQEEREIIDQGVAPVPAMNYILKVRKSYSGSIMVSGSHIKPHLNGVKFFAFEEEISKKHEKEIGQIYQKIKTKVKMPLNTKHELQDENTANETYQEMLFKQSKRPYPKWKAVVDTGDGAQSDTMPQVLQRLGIEVIELNTTIQGEFFSRDTEVQGDFKDLQETVKKHKADFGIGYDSDGDRVIFIDEKGDYIPGDYTGTLIAREMETESVVTPINVSQVVDHINKRVIRTKVGSPFVVEKVKRFKLPFGFEANGGGVFAEMLSRDGGRTTVEILNILSRSKKKLSQLVAELPKFYLARDKVDYKWELKEKIIKEAKKHFKGEKIEEMDGLKIWMDDTTWILFRSSLNAPEFRVFAESESESKANDLLNQGVSFVKKMIG